MNTYRQDPVTYNQGNNYRKFIYKYYENQNKDKCIRHGGYDNEYYALKKSCTQKLDLNPI